MKKTISAIMTLIIVTTAMSPAWAVPVGNDVEYIPFPRNLGVGVIAPQAKLDVNGQVMIRGGAPAAGRVLTSNSVGLATWQPISTLNVTNINNSLINGGILNSTFINGSVLKHNSVDGVLSFTKNGSIAGLKTLTLNGLSLTPGSIVNGGTFINPTINLSKLVSPNGAINPAVSVINSGNVGIGTITPTEKLEVAGKVKATHFIGDGSSLTNIPLSALSGGGSIEPFSVNGALTVEDLTVTNGVNLNTSNIFGGDFFGGNGRGLVNLTATQVFGTLTNATISGFTGPLAGDVTGTQSATVISNNAITSAKILNGTVATADLADASITDAKIVSVSASKVTGLLSPTVTIPGTQVTGTVANATNAVNATNATNAATAVNFTGVLAGDVTGPQGATVISNNAITSAKILNGTVATADLADASITDAKIVSVSASKVTGLLSPTVTIPGTQVTGTVANATNANNLVGTGVISGTHNLTTGSNLTLASGANITGDQNTSIFTGNGSGLKHIPLSALSGGGSIEPFSVNGALTVEDLTVTNGVNLNTSNIFGGDFFGGNGRGLVNLTATQVFGTLTNATISGFTGPLAGDVTGTQGATVIGSNKITSAKILNGTVATADLANASITDAKIVSVSASKITGAIGSTTINNSTFIGGTINGATLINSNISKLVAPDGSPNPAVQVDNIGRVGIGTTTPSATLHISGSGANLKLQDVDSPLATVANPYITFHSSDGTQLGYVGDSSTNAVNGNVMVLSSTTGKVLIRTVSADPIHLITRDSTRMTVEANGNVGVGTRLPSEKLQVIGNVKANRFIGDGSGLTNIVLPNNSVGRFNILPNSITTNLIANGHVTEADLGYGSVTTVKIANDAVTRAKIAANAITTDLIANGSVTNADLGTASITGIKIANDAIDRSKIAANAISTDLIANGNVTEADLGTASVTNTKIANNAVTDAKIVSISASKVTGALSSSVTIPGTQVTGTVATATNATNFTGVLAGDLTGTQGATVIGNSKITSAKIANDAVDRSKIAANAISTDLIANGNVTEADLGTASVTANKIANDAVTRFKIAANAISTDLIANGHVTNADLGVNSVTNDKIANNAITDAKIVSISASKITGSITPGAHDHSRLVTPNTNTAVVTVTSGGLVGLGTAAPTEELEVNGDVKADNFKGCVVLQDGTRFCNLAQLKALLTPATPAGPSNNASCGTNNWYEVSATSFLNATGSAGSWVGGGNWFTFDWTLCDKQTVTSNVDNGGVRIAFRNPPRAGTVTLKIIRTVSSNFRLDFATNILWSNGKPSTGYLNSAGTYIFTCNYDGAGTYTCSHT